MRLRKITLNSNGSVLEFGPLSVGANVFSGPPRCGKTTIVQWLHRVLADAASPATGPSHHLVEGRIDLVNRGEVFSVDPARGGRDPQDSGAAGLTENQRTTLRRLAEADYADDPIAHLRELAASLGLAPSPAQTVAQRESLLVRRAEIESLLRQIGEIGSTPSELESRRDRLRAELVGARTVASDPAAGLLSFEQRRLEARLVAVEKDLRDAQAEVAEIDEQLAQVQPSKRQLTTTPAVEVQPSLRRQLQQLDERLVRWRQTLVDIREQRMSMESNATDVRLDEQIGEQLATTRHADPRAAMRSLETQLMATQKQLNEIVHEYRIAPAVERRDGSPDASPNQPVDATSHGIFRTDDGRTYLAPAAYVPQIAQLPETLARMHRDVTEICRQLARFETRAQTDTLRGQCEQLQRCERELLIAIEKLIDQRAELLRRIADEQHLSIEELNMAFGQWCRCQDHRHIDQWLRAHEHVGSDAPSTGPHGSGDNHLAAEHQRLREHRSKLTQRIEVCRREIQDLQHQRAAMLHTRPTGPERTEADVQRELDTVMAQLGQLLRREDLERELHAIDRQLNQQRDVASAFSEAVDRHLLGLLGASDRDPLRSRQIVVAPALSALAGKLAIVEAMQRRGEPIPLILDATLDHLADAITHRAAQHLVQVSRTGQQIIAFTSDQSLAEAFRMRGAWCETLPCLWQSPDKQYPALAESEEAVNRKLAEAACEQDDATWYDSASARTRPTEGDFFLSEADPVDAIPDLDPAVVARCRAFGVDTVADFLDVSADWLADAIDIDGVSAAVLRRWQAEASLLTHVRFVRPFDARVLVGAGIRRPGDIARLSPSELLERVEEFLNKPRGQRLMRSASRRELARLTNWLAAARHRHGSASSRRVPAWRKHQRSSQPRGGHQDWQQRRARRSPRTGSRSDRARTSSPADLRTARTAEDRAATQSHRRSTSGTAADRAESRDETPARFYLELSSPIVDAPSIGARTAERLEAVGIATVRDLLDADPQQLAELLDAPRITAKKIAAWQHQARLVCQIPNLRGHDAQFLVACQIYDPDALAQADPEELYASIRRLLGTKTGQRILRGGKEPDRDEIEYWIASAGQHRTLRAA